MHHRPIIGGLTYLGVVHASLLLQPGLQHAACQHPGNNEINTAMLEVPVVVLYHTAPHYMPEKLLK